MIVAIMGLIITAVIGSYALLTARKIYRQAPLWVEPLIENLPEKVDSVIDRQLERAMAPDPKTGLNLIDMLAARFGKGFRMSLLAQKSGEARHENMIEKRVFSAAKDNIPELQLAMSAMEQFGLGDLATPENLPALLKVAQKYGLFGGGLTGKPQNNGGGRGREIPVM